MYFIKTSTINVPRKFFPKINIGYAKNNSKAVSTTILGKKTLSEATDTLQDYNNIIREKEDGYEFTEYYIEDTEINCPNYILVTEKSYYSAEQFATMVKILKELNFYNVLSTVIAYERYGFLTLKKENDASWFIEYKDERQTMRGGGKYLELEHIKLTKR